MRGSSGSRLSEKPPTFLNALSVRWANAFSLKDYIGQIQDIIKVSLFKANCKFWARTVRQMKVETDLATGQPPPSPPAHIC